MEQTRGYDGSGSLWSPGYFRADAAAGQQIVTLIASTEPWDTIEALDARGRAPAPRSSGAGGCSRSRATAGASDAFAAELVLAADQFIITPAGRVEERRARARPGDEVRTVIAGYHWFTDWGRDTMISLEGLTLATGRYREAATSCARSRITSATA